MTQPADIAAHFQFEGRFERAELCENGHINDTYTVTCQAGSYILQKINPYVFRDPPAMMENIRRVTAHLGQKIRAAGGDPRRETLNLVPALDGACFYRDPSGDYWRAYLFVTGARSFEQPEDPGQVFQAARAFGRFQAMLTDFPAESLHATIPNFHHTPLRFQAFARAVEQDACHRAAGVKAEIQFLEARAGDAGKLLALADSGQLPLRVTHNDTKFNNVLLDDRTGEGVCVIDLDTVMPGLAPYDFGDMVRSAAALTAEDEPEGAGISLATFETLARGYLSAAGSFLTAAEGNALAFSALLITYEQALRFLGDYLNGDVYYKIRRPGQNLDRARSQIRMVRGMEEKYAEMQQIIAVNWLKAS